MGFSIDEFWDTSPILYYLLVEQYNKANSSENSTKDTKVYYKEDL